MDRLRKKPPSTFPGQKVLAKPPPISKPTNLSKPPPTKPSPSASRRQSFTRNTSPSLTSPTSTEQIQTSTIAKDKSLHTIQVNSSISSNSKPPVKRLPGPQIASSGAVKRPPPTLIASPAKRPPPTQQILTASPAKRPPPAPSLSVNAKKLQKIVSSSPQDKKIEGYQSGEQLSVSVKEKNSFTEVQQSTNDTSSTDSQHGLEVMEIDDACSEDVNKCTSQDDAIPALDTSLNHEQVDNCSTIIVEYPHEPQVTYATPSTTSSEVIIAQSAANALEGLASSFEIHYAQADGTPIEYSTLQQRQYEQDGQTVVEIYLEHPSEYQITEASDITCQPSSSYPQHAVLQCDSESFTASSAIQEEVRNTPNVLAQDGIKSEENMLEMDGEFRKSWANEVDLHRHYVAVAEYHFTKASHGCACNICGEIVPYKYNSQGSDKTPVSLWSHLRRKHPEEHSIGQKRLLELRPKTRQYPDPSERSNTSFARPYFVFVSLDQGYVCKICGDYLKCRFDAHHGHEKTTTDFWRHLKRKHIEVYNECKKSNSERRAHDEKVKQDYRRKYLGADSTALQPQEQPQTEQLPDQREHNRQPHQQRERPNQLHQQVSAPAQEEVQNNWYAEPADNDFDEDGGTGCLANDDEQPVTVQQVSVLEPKTPNIKHKNRPGDRSTTSIARQFFVFVNADKGYVCKLCGDRVKCRWDPSHHYEKTATDFWRHLKRRHTDQFNECKKNLEDKKAAWFSVVQEESSVQAAAETEALSYEVVMNSEGQSADILDVIINDYDAGNTAREFDVQKKSVSDVNNSKPQNISGKIESVHKHIKSTPKKSQNGIGMNLNKQNKIDGLVLQMLVADLQSCSFIESKGFHDLMRALDPIYKVPSFNKLSFELIPQAYETVRLDIKLSLKFADMVAITIHSWVCWNSDKYVTISAHFFTSVVQEEKSVVISTIKVDKYCSVEEFAVNLQNVFLDWGIEEKICFAITDNSPILEDAMQKLGLQHVPCIDIFLAKCLREAVDQASDIMSIAKKIKTVATYFKNEQNLASETANILKELQYVDIDLSNDSTAKEPKWMAVLNIFRSYVPQHETISTAFCLLSKSDECITEVELGKMKKVIETLEPFELVKKEINEGTFVTISVVVPLLKQLQECLSKLQHWNFEFSTKLYSDVDQLLTAVQDNFFVNVSTILDPCFKHLPFVGDLDRVRNIESWLLPKLNNMYEAAKAEAALIEDNPKHYKSKLWENFDSQAAVSASDPTVELKQYFAYAQPKRQDSNPREWWETNKQKFPNLTKLARQFLAMPATLVSASPLYMNESEELVAKRSYLEADYVDKVLFLHKNLTRTQQNLKF